MLSYGGQSMRAFRPSSIAGLDGCEEEDEAQVSYKQVNIERYAKRVRDGLPLFEDLPITERRIPGLI